MVEGILVVNLDPPYLGFVQKLKKDPGLKKFPQASFKNCTLKEVHDVLLDLGVISTQQHWPPRDCMIRIPTSLPASTLKKYGLQEEPQV